MWELAQLERWDAHNRTYDLVIVDAPASGHGLAMLTAPSTFGEIARVGPIRRQAFKVRDMLADPRRTGLRRGRAAGGDAGQRDARARRRGCTTRSGSGSTRSSSTALYPDRFSGKEAEALRAAAGERAASPSALAAVRAALAEHERARASARTCGGSSARPDAPVHTLPFLFDAEVGLDEYGTLAAQAGPVLDIGK